MTTSAAASWYDTFINRELSQNWKLHYNHYAYENTLSLQSNHHLNLRACRLRAVLCLCIAFIGPQVASISCIRAYSGSGFYKLSSKKLDGHVWRKAAFATGIFRHIWCHSVELGKWSCSASRFVFLLHKPARVTFNGSITLWACILSFEKFRSLFHISI